ncbi:CaiB/BaiF CoA transferase family protein [Sedimentitalea todarodis]|uniref:CaiB/BaiF CoA-transferase family protein n=1 Tax=Sedimentitalea todarodis TaxID=1631240 RepID=A0ABU3VAX7_9RHOB|nr:CaiB/BaiF CoA-transferase family protein [Sedimentitalea todarodis]MDU9003319.1 CaiB/BaiF CoA-transferase family protein [Sedimentitalea todarodis]
MLNGIRVVEIEGLGPGPFAGMLLADLGADVIVVHRAAGEPAPGMPERPILDRGKRSITLDLKSPQDRKTALRLIATADALIEGFRPGVMERLGLGPEPCHALNPALVYGRMTGWGQDGPLSDRAGHDMNYIGLAGALWHASPIGQPPIAPPTLIGDIGGGALYLVVGILAGILNARATGRGTVVDAAIYDGAANMMNLLMSLAQSGGFSSERGQSLLDGPHWSRTYATSDGGFMSVQCLEPKFYAMFLDLLGLADDTDFADQFDRRKWPVLSKRLESLFAGRSLGEWQAVFEGTDACVAPVLTPEQSLHHPINKARQTWHDTGGTLQAAPAPRFAGAAAWSPRPVPARGEHSDEIIAELDENGG